MVVNCGIYGMALLLMFVLHGGKHWEEYGICHSIHIVISCLNYLTHFLFLIQSANVRCRLFLRAWHAISHGCMLSPLGRSALHCSLRYRYKFDIQCLLNTKFNHCSVIWNHYESSVPSELLANVAVLRDMSHFRDNPSLCSGLFDTGEIDAAIKSICTEW